jgi:predicted amidohydrolase YtcJ
MTARLISAGGQAVEVAEGRIRRIGPVRELRRDGLVEETFSGGAILAPLHDHHFHPIGYAAAVTRLSLKAAADFDDLRRRLSEAAAALEPGEALVGNRLDDESLAEGRLPTREDLDRMMGDRPVLLFRYCGHVAVANSAALHLAGVDRGDGVLRETAVQPVAEAVGSAQPPLPPAQVRRALAGLVSLGLGTITAIVSAGEPLWCGVPDEIGTLLSVAADLPLEFKVLVIAQTPAQLVEAAGRLGQGPANLSFLGWKEFADGSLGGRTAALYQPYLDDPTNSGTLRLDEDHALLMSRASLELGGMVAIHAIGDLANDRVLEVFQTLVRGGADPAFLRIEHASVLRPESIDLMAQLGVTASVQPAFITSEVGWLEKRLGERAASTYVLSDLGRAGVAMVGGSDSPVEAPNPWMGVAAARVGGLGAAEALSLFGGSLRVGDPAHLIVTDRHPLHAGDPGKTEVLAAYRSGEAFEPETELTFS